MSIKIPAITLLQVRKSVYYVNSVEIWRLFQSLFGLNLFTLSWVRLYDKDVEGRSQCMKLKKTTVFSFLPGIFTVDLDVFSGPWWKEPSSGVCPRPFLFIILVTRERANPHPLPASSCVRARSVKHLYSIWFGSLKQLRNGNYYFRFIQK